MGPRPSSLRGDAMQRGQKIDISLPSFVDPFRVYSLRIATPTTGYTGENFPDVQLVDELDITLISCFTRATNPDLVFVLVQEVADFPNEKRHRRRKIAHAT